MEDQATYRRFGVICAIICAGTLGPYLAGLHGAAPFLLDSHDVVVGRDFLNTWLYGQAFWKPDPGRFYDQAVYERAVQAIFPANQVEHIWSYPPPFLLLAAPFGLLSYPLALALWTLFGLIALYLTVFRRGWPWRAASILFAPVVLQTVVVGQISLFFAAALLWIFRAMDRYPVRAGLLLSCLSVKPQLVLLFPVLLVVSRRWRVLFAAAAGVAGIIAVSIALNGVQTWIDFITLGVPAQAANVRTAMVALGQVSVTPTSSLTLMGVPALAVTLVQVSATLLAAALVAYAGIHTKMARQSGAEALIFLSCSVFATPYLLAHDLAALTAGAVLLIPAGDSVRGKTWLLFVLFMPSIQIALGAVNIHSAFLIPIGFALWQTVRLKALVEHGRARDALPPVGPCILDAAPLPQKFPAESLRMP